MEKFRISYGSHFPIRTCEVFIGDRWVEIDEDTYVKLTTGKDTQNNETTVKILEAGGGGGGSGKTEIENSQGLGGIGTMEIMEFIKDTPEEEIVTEELNNLPMLGLHAQLTKELTEKLNDRFEGQVIKDIASELAVTLNTWTSDVLRRMGEVGEKPRDCDTELDRSIRGYFYERIRKNEIAKKPYSGLDTLAGWGVNDKGSLDTMNFGDDDLDDDDDFSDDNGIEYDHAILDEFEKMLNETHEQTIEYPTSTYEYQFEFTKEKPSLESKSKHKDHKVIKNSANGNEFWVCKDCKIEVKED